ncbi:MAG: DNA-binding protein [Chloroflexi bacterium]|nr:DNA-binding protein [Chloroflexota bacterium]MDA1270341.1 DNA-binding protein [Chloroflexota bacterium]
MAVQQWESKTSGILYSKFQAGESLVNSLETLALANGIREAIVTSCIGSLSELKLRNLCNYDAGVPDFQRQVITETMELVSAEGYIQPLPDGGVRVHIHVAAARPSGEMIGGHCEEATLLSGAFMYLHVIEQEPVS